MGSYNMAARLRFGATSFKISIHFSSERCFVGCEACRIPAGSRQTGDKALTNRISYAGEDHRNGGSASQILCNGN